MPNEMPRHVVETVSAIEQLHERHQEEATSFERFAERIARSLGEMHFLVVVTVLIVAWVGVNTLGRGVVHPFDPAPFPWLTAFLTLLAVYLTLLILAGQRRSERLGRHREQLTLQIALLNEQKSAKIIALLEEQRRESPVLSNRKDPEADAMAAAVDPRQVSEAIREIDQE